MNIFSRAFQKARALYLRFRIGNVVTVAVLITQALKRFVDSDLGKFLMDLVPVPWMNLSVRILSLISTANTHVPAIARKILISHFLLTSGEEQDAVQLLTIHLRMKTKEERALYWQEFCDALILAMSDEVITPEELADIRQEFYTKLLKT